MIMWFIFFSLLTTTCFLFSTCAAWGGGVADWTQGAVDGREQTDLFTWGIIYAHIPVQWLLRLNTSSWDYFPRFSPNPPKLCLLKSSSKRAAVSLHQTLSSLKPAERLRFERDSVVGWTRTTKCIVLGLHMSPRKKSAMNEFLCRCVDSQDLLNEALLSSKWPACL